MGNEDQALTVHSKKSRRDNYHHQGNHSHQKENSVISSKDLSKLRCYTCDERGHFARNCDMNKNDSQRRRTTKEDIMLTLQRMMILAGKESNKKMKTLQVMKNMF